MSPRLPSLSERLERARERHLLSSLRGMGARLQLYRQVHALLRAGTPLPILFAELEKATPRLEHRNALGRAARRIAAGGKLADGLKEAAGLFDPLTLALIAAGESSGTLERTFAARIAQLERFRRLVLQAVMSALYPAYLLGAVIFIAPLLELPAAIQSAGSSSMGTAYAWGVARSIFWVAVVAGSLLALPFLVAALDVEAPWERARLRWPLFGPIYRNLYAARLLSVLGGALEAGLEAGQSVRLAVGATRSPAFAPRAAEVERRVRGGESLTEGLASLGLLDAATLGIVSIGERTGEAPTQMQRTAEELFDTAARQIRTATLAVMGVSVALAFGVIVMRMLQSLMGGLVESYKTIEGLERR